MDAFLYLANGLNLLSYTVRDILHLRLLTLASVSCLALYFGSRPEPLVEVVCWNLVFVLLNAVHLGRILKDRKSSRFVRNIAARTGPARQDTRALARRCNADSVPSLARPPRSRTHLPATARDPRARLRAVPWRSGCPLPAQRAGPPHTRFADSGA